MSPLSDDHLDKWKYQQHTRAKHDVLRYYLDVWIRIVSDKRYKLRVFDCFAGRGDYEGSDGASPIDLETIDSDTDYPGSPLIMMDILSEHNRLFEEAECYFIEPNHNNRSELEKNIRNVDGLADNVSVSMVEENFDKGVLRAISDSGGFQGFGFFFIDPFGLKSLEYDTVQTVASIQRFDCLITLMTKELIRWQDSHLHGDTFERLYGTTNWKKELQSYQPRHLETAEAEYYCNRLENDGVEYTLGYMTTRGDSIELMYDLVFTTNSEKGLEVMKESMTRCGSDYTLAYAPQRSDIGTDEQTTIVGGELMTEKKRAKAYLVSRFAGQVLTFDEVITRVFDDPHRRYADSLRQDYRQYLKDLDNAKKIEIPKRDSKDSPLSEDYPIQFPSMEEY